MPSPVMGRGNVRSRGSARATHRRHDNATTGALGNGSSVAEAAPGRGVFGCGSPALVAIVRASLSDLSLCRQPERTYLSPLYTNPARLAYPRTVQPGSGRRDGRIRPYTDPEGL